MEFLTAQTALFAGKWIFVGLIYFVLLAVLVAVRREMALHVPVSQPLASMAVGRLLVNQASRAAAIQPGAILLLKPENTLGAEPGNDLVLKDDLVSGRHARLRWDGAGWWVEDLGSTNGTFVNGERIVALTAHRLALGAHIQLGETVFQLQE